MDDNDEHLKRIDQVDKEYYHRDETKAYMRRIKGAAKTLGHYYKDEQRPLIQNEFLYKAIVRTTYAYFKDILECCEGLEWLEDHKLINKKGLKELEFYLAC